MEFIYTLLVIVACHLIGDYFLQTPFIAQTKGENWYHMFIHCFLYCLPFAFAFGFDWRIAVLFVTHIIIDPLKARWGKINYTWDQILHYVIALLLFML